ncbi:hypothetical protein [Pseudactinotalea terrae]|uniref:hypothetical protein n=1 Tax=Pseudactinotalea terrae TaxID=1743262 RepID=UPI0012E225DE|nr:hypothetical protein [Pseudactinotalea terrae]
MMRRAFRAVVTATAAAGVGITAFGERPLLIGTVAGICALFSIGWPTLLGLPARRGAVVVLLLTSGAAVTVVEITEDVAWAALVLAGSVLAAFVNELARRDGRPRLVESVSGVVAGCAIVVAGVGWLAMGTGGSQVGLVLTGSVTLAAAAALSAAPIPAPYSAIVTIVLTAVVGLLIGYLLISVGMTTGVLIGLAAGVLIATVHHLFGQFPSSNRLFPAMSAAMLPVAVAGLPVYVLGRVLLAV